MRWAVALSLGVALLGGAAGCRSNCDRVESELRARESDVRELREELERADAYNQLMQRELHALRGEPGPDGHVERPVEAYPVRALVLGRQTGGRPSDAGAGDDALQVMVEPRDPEGQAIKAPGALRVEAQEVTAEGLKRPLSAWEVPPEQLRRSWQTGLFTNGYLVTLPWKVWPSTEKLRVIARLKLNDGRVFEADKDVSVRVAPAHLRRTPAAPPVLPAPKPVGPPAPLPPPLPTAPPPTPVPIPVPTPADKQPAAPPPTPEGPSLDQAALYRDAALRLRPAAEILRPVAPGR
jgi:hypothetical protein